MFACLAEIQRFFAPNGHIEHVLFHPHVIRQIIKSCTAFQRCPEYWIFHSLCPSEYCASEKKNYLKRFMTVCFFNKKLSFQNLTKILQNAWVFTFSKKNAVLISCGKLRVGYNYPLSPGIPSNRKHYFPRSLLLDGNGKFWCCLLDGKRKICGLIFRKKIPIRRKWKILMLPIGRKTQNLWSNFSKKNFY